MMSGLASDPGDSTMVPLAVLLKREMCNEKVERPDILYGQARQNRKGEDFTFVKADCQRIEDDEESTFSVFALFDGHNGSAAAIYSKEHLLNNLISAIPRKLRREEWIAALPRALVAAFVKTDKEFQIKGVTSGTTATFVIIDEWIVTVASVGDSRCILESAEGAIYFLSADHRLEANVEEVERVTSSGGEVGRIHICGGAEIGPLRCWPGGLCLSRSIGDLDVGEFIVPVPHVKQVKLSNAGGRLVIASDGVWDALEPEKAFDCSRGLPAEAAARRIVNEAVREKGLKDDTTCIVVDILPPEKLSPSIPKKPSKVGLKSIFRRKSADSLSNDEVDRGCSEADVVEELYEEGSAMLAERLNSGSVTYIFRQFKCAVCQVEMKPGEGVPINGSPPRSSVCISGWDGPYLCQSCQVKKAAMEGKLSSDSHHSKS